MSYTEIFFLAIALSIDACIVSFSYGLAYNEKRLQNSSLLASFTGIFQGLMPVIGYYLTGFVKMYIQPYAGIIVFLIFVYLGLRFIKEAFEKKDAKQLCIDIKCLFLVAVATSIDAFSAGISLSLFGNKILKPALLFIIVTYVNSSLGFWFGGRLKNLPTRGLEITAGILLILLGIKAL